MNHFYRTLGTVVLLSIVMFTTTGCDQIREKVSNLINPKTPQQVLESANQKIANQKFKDALAEIESFGKSDGNLEGDFALAAAKSSFQVGENDKGYAYLSKALKANSISSERSSASTSLSTTSPQHSNRLHFDFIRYLTTNANDAEVRDPTAKKNVLLKSWVHLGIIIYV